MNEQRQRARATAWNVTIVFMLLIVGCLLVWLAWQVTVIQERLQDLDGKLEVVGLTLENQRGRMDDLAAEVREQRISTRTAIKNLTLEIERQNEPSELVFRLDTDEIKARRMWKNCVADRLAAAMGPLGAMLTQAEGFEDAMDFDQVVGFSEGEMSRNMEIGFMGAFFGCWTLGSLTPSY